MQYALLTDNVVEGAYRYVDYLCKIRKKLDDYDLVQELRGAAHEALLHACETYDDTRGASFITWAKVLVRKAVKRAYGESLIPLLPVPFHVRKRWYEARDARARFESREMRQPTNVEWAHEAGMDVGEMLELRDMCHQTRQLMDCGETDEVDVEDEHDYAELHGIFKDAEQATAILISAREAVGDDKVKVFVYVTFNEDDLSQKDVAEMFDIDQSTVSRWCKEVAEFIRITLEKGK